MHGAYPTGEVGSAAGSTANSGLTIRGGCVGEIVCCCNLCGEHVWRYDDGRGQGNPVEHPIHRI